MNGDGLRLRKSREYDARRCVIVSLICVFSFLRMCDQKASGELARGFSFGLKMGDARSERTRWLGRL